MTTKDIKDTKDEAAKEELRERHYPSVEIAEARIKQALLRYKVAVERTTPMDEEEKVRL